VEAGGEDRFDGSLYQGRSSGASERDGKNSTDNRNGEHEKDYNNKLAARHRFSRLVQCTL
jgi:hypothetical protein